MLREVFDGLPRPLLFGHRGASARAPENTLDSFALAIKEGVDVLEMDVHMSADQEIVVIHDADVSRTTNGHGLVKDLRYKEIRTLDSGWCYQDAEGRHRWRGRGVFVPRLRDVLEAFPDACLNIEVKQGGPSMLAEFLALTAHIDPRRLVLAAADHRINQRLMELAQGYTVGLSSSEAKRLLVASLLGFPTNPRTKGRPLQIPPMYRGFRLLRPSLLRRAKDADCEIHVWTVNDEKEANRILGYGVGGIMTDDPASVVGAVRARRCN